MYAEKYIIELNPRNLILQSKSYRSHCFRCINSYDPLRIQCWTTTHRIRIGDIEGQPIMWDLGAFSNEIESIGWIEETKRRNLPNPENSRRVTFQSEKTTISIREWRSRFCAERPKGGEFTLPLELAMVSYFLSYDSRVIVIEQCPVKICLW